MKQTAVLFSSLLWLATLPAAVHAQAMTGDDVNRTCISEPSVGDGRRYGGTLTVEVTNNCSATADIRVCMHRQNGTWDCRIQTTAVGDAFKMTFYSGADGRVFVDARDVHSNRRMPTPD